MEAPNKVLVAGGQGRLGRALGAVGGPRVVAVGRNVLDITDADTIARVLLAVQPAAVINAAVARGIELAEADPSDAQAINAVGPAKLAELCARASIPLIHISTDYVFGAETNRPWREDDPVSPVNVYGRTKADGERRVLAVHARACVVRVAWLFGDGDCRRSDRLSDTNLPGRGAAARSSGADDSGKSERPSDPARRRFPAGLKGRLGHAFFRGN
jgi:dTDP-4-dehydrorhamnose reductase